MNNILLKNLNVLAASHIESSISLDDIIVDDMDQDLDDIQYECFMELSGSQSWEELLRSYEGMTIEEFLNNVI